MQEMPENSVERLSAAPCPCPSHGLEPPYIEGVYQPDHPSAEAWGRRCNHCQAAAAMIPRFCQCGGTGALVPGLREECPVHESTRIGHKALGDPLREYPCHEKCSGCQGRGWTLIPAAEQMGVLVRKAGDMQLGEGNHKRWFAELIFADGPEDAHEADTPEEALASAILQVLNIEGD